MNRPQPLGSIEILPATADHLPGLAKLAGLIWRECYPGIIPSEQIDYMLARMYSLDMLRTEIQSQGIRYDRLLVDGKLVGFASYGPVSAAPPPQTVDATPRRLPENHPPFETKKNEPAAAHTRFGDAASPPQSSRPAVFKLHKLYLLPGLHGRGLGSLLLQHCERESRRLGARRLILSVNKRNTMAIAAYQRNGFDIADSVVTDIGNGFVMDDYIMAKDLAQCVAADVRRLKSIFIQF